MYCIYIYIYMIISITHIYIYIISVCFEFHEFFAGDFTHIINMDFMG